MADQTHALVKYFTSAESSLDTIPAHKPGDKSFTIFNSLFHRVFIKYSLSTGTALTLILLTTSIGFSFLALPTVTIPKVFIAICAVISAFIGALAGSNLAALWMGSVLNKRLSWFSSELYPLFLYGPPTLAGSSA
jgi:hypothetical protein